MTLLDSENASPFLCHSHPLSAVRSACLLLWWSLDSQFQCRTTEVPHTCWFQWVPPTIRTWPFQSKAVFEDIQLTVILILTWHCTSPLSSPSLKYCCFSLQWLKDLRALQKQDQELFWSSLCQFFSFFFCRYRKGVMVKLLFLNNFPSCYCSAGSGPIYWTIPSHTEWLDELNN